MQAKLKNSKHPGTFAIAPGREFYGELKLAGPKTKLYLRDEDFFNAHGIPNLCVKGVLHDLTKVTLVDCISSGTGSASHGTEGYHFSTLFPHFVVRGDRHINPDEKMIAAVHFLIDDAATLFYDFDAFGAVIDARPLISQVVSANKIDREVAIGECPQIQYFTGKQQIFSTDTPIGKVSAYHSPSWSLGGPQGVYIKNKIRVSVEFVDDVKFRDAIDQVYLLRDYFGLLVGRPQNLSEIRLRLKSSPDQPIGLDVHWSWCPKRKKSASGYPPHPADVLIDAVRQPETFSTILVNWLDRQPTWRDARQRFHGIFARQRTYDIDRLVGAANMFDILPPSACPSGVELGPEMEEAKENARRVFKDLPASPERDSVLGALGRLGKPSLKRKVRFRAQIVLNALPEHFPELISVTDKAVDCRNYFVHGGEPPMDYSENSDMVWLFVDALEFVFAASDLIEAGWSIGEWSARSSISHPFGRYVRNYPMQLKRFQLATRGPAIAP